MCYLYYVMYDACFVMCDEHCMMCLLCVLYVIGDAKLLFDAKYV